ncbi:MAG: hypothetical protein AB7S41_01345 [Parvibaculaceae bacterium]
MDWASFLVAFLSGGALVWFGQLGLDRWRRPIMEVSYSPERGSEVQPKFGGDIYCRLIVKNNGQTTIRDCTGMITRFTRRKEGVTTNANEVIQLRWALSHEDIRDIPRGAYFHLDVVVRTFLGGLPALAVCTNRLPTTGQAEVLGGDGAYEIDILIAADNSPPVKCTLLLDIDYSVPNKLFKAKLKERAELPWPFGWMRKRLAPAETGL